MRLPYVDTLEKAAEVAQRIDRSALEAGVPPIVFSTLVNPDILARVRQANGVFLTFGTFVSHIEQALGLKSSHSIGRSHMAANSEKYRNRIDAINFSLAHDDGSSNQLDQADVILVGVSRCGKTPTSLYLAMQYAIKAANFPLTPDDFERGTLPPPSRPTAPSLFGLSIQPERLAEVRNERRPNSRYAQLEQCRYEVAEAERMMRREGISWCRPPPSPSRKSRPRCCRKWAWTGPERHAGDTPPDARRRGGAGSTRRPPGPPRQPNRPYRRCENGSTCDSDSGRNMLAAGK